MKGVNPWFCGVAAVLVTAGLLFAVFGPTVRPRVVMATPGGEGRSEESTKSLFEDGIEPVTWTFIGLVAAGAAVLGGAALAGLLGTNRGAPQIALVATASLLVLAIVSGFSIGWAFLPGALLGVVGAALWNR